MDHAYHTRELARAYEAQGYYREALEIYTRLDETSQGADTDVTGSCRRLETLLEEDAARERDARLSVLLEDWLTLWVTSRHLATMDHLISQVRSRK